MSDYIKREDAMDAWYTNERYTDIEGIPSANVVEQKHGKWLDATTLDNEFICWVCSECRHGADFVYEPYNYCPNCGAEMKIEDE